MKRFIFVVLTLFISLLCFSRVNADAVLETQESSLGSINLSLSFSEGYVGALDVSIKLQGNVKISGFVWDSSLSAYIKRYSYDASSKVIRFVISTGDASRNLLDKYGKLNIGEIKLSNSTNSQQSYSFSIVDADVVDAEYRTNTNLSVSDASVSEYVLKVENTSTSPEVSTPNYTESNNSSNITNNYNSDSNFNEEENIDLEEDEADEKAEEEIENNEDDIIPIINDSKNTSNNSDDESKNVETHNQRIVRYLWTVLGILIIIAIMLAGIYAKKQNKLNKVQ